ncbi:hypothetical protein OQX61_07475 [Pedobacter sp. PLR]|uniref:hypothetical protein n=1 Tax=Pedobacter sp. PLR TaxID=2994465 RepID=UPI0022475892|nr:hypothetical protein [Pedobacter sp. PLR]MCX2451109.1 hypothetical protein [Pedobacter sp. PLR]
MLEVNDLITLINYSDNPTLTDFFDINVEGLDKYVKPETNILSWVMLSKARNQGLDVVFVDDDKFFDGSFNRIKGTLLNGTEPFEGAWYIEFELAPVLLHGQTFSLIDHSESMGYGVMIDTGNLINELISHYLKDTGKVDYGTLEEFKAIETIQQLTNYINRMLTIPEPKTPWYSKLPSLSAIGLYLVGVIVLIGVGIYYVFKYISRFFRYIKYLLNKPL